MDAASMSASIAARPVVGAAAPAASRPQVQARARLPSSRPGRFAAPSLRQRGMSCERRSVVVAAAEAGEEVAAETSEEAPAKGRGRRQQREVTLPFEDIVAGNTYKGTVKSTTAFGAFVDIGSSTDGLLHISQLSNSFVENVADVVTVGQEVEVRVLETDAAKGRFSLTMKAEQAAEEAGAPGTGRVPERGQVRQARRGGNRGEKKAPVELPFSAGDTITGTVARTMAFGAFVTVAEGVEGLLHTSELARPADKAPDCRVDEVLKEGDSVEVKVLDIKSGKISLTNISDEQRARDKAMVNEGIGAVADATTSLEYAMKMAGLDASKFASRPAEKAPEPEPEPVVEEAAPAAAAAAPVEEKAAPAAPKEEKAAPKAAAAGGVSAKDVKALRDQTGAGMMDCKKALAECGGDLQAASEFLRKKGIASASKKAGRIAAEGSIATYIHAGDRLGVMVEVNCETDFVARGEIFQNLAADIAMQIAACPEVSVVSVDDIDAAVMAKEKEIEMGKEDILSKPENIREKIVEGRLKKTAETMALLNQPFIKDSDKTIDQLLKETIAATGENVMVRRFARYELGEGIEKKADNFAEEVASMGKAEPKKEEPKKEEAPKAEEAAPAAPKVEVSAKLVKQLRDQSGAGMMDCKKALAECGGDVQAASEFLRKKGIAKADKKAGRVAAEGVVASYIHAGSRLGVLMELNCETDFVARGDKFKQLAADMAMQIAACPDVSVVRTEDVDPAFLERERAIEMQKEDVLAKPENIREKIVDGRIAKIAKEAALYEQEFVKDTSKTVGEVIKEAIAGIGENIQVRRFERFNLGEGIEKKTTDLAAEVAAITGGN